MTKTITTRIAKWLIGAAALATISGTAAARDNVALSISIGTSLPVYAAPAYARPPAPAYVSAHVGTAPMYAAPVYAPPMYAPPMYAGPAYVSVPPRVVYYAAPGYGPRWHGHGRSWGHDRRGWR